MPLHKKKKIATIIRLMDDRVIERVVRANANMATIKDATVAAGLHTDLPPEILDNIIGWIGALNDLATSPLVTKIKELSEPSHTVEPDTIGVGDDG